MTEGRPVSLPEPVEIVSADEVEAIIRDSDRRLSALERQARDEERIAAQYEARVRAEGLDERWSNWAIVRLERFLTDLRAEAENDADIVLAAAERAALSRVEDARAEAARLRYADVAEVAPLVDLLLEESREGIVPHGGPVARPDGAPAMPLKEPPPVGASPWIALSPPVAPIEAVQADPLAANLGSASVEASRPETAVSWVPADGNGHAPPPLVADDLPSPVSAAPVVAAAAPVLAPAVPEVTPPPATTDQTAAMPVPAPQNRSAKRKARRAARRQGKKRGAHRRFPLSAILEVIAVLLVLVFILVRLS